MSCFLRVLGYFKTFLENKFPGGGGGAKKMLEKQLFLISFHVLCYFVHLKKIVFGEILKSDLALS